MYVPRMLSQAELQLNAVLDGEPEIKLSTSTMLLCCSLFPGAFKTVIFLTYFNTGCSTGTNGAN